MERIKDQLCPISGSLEPLMTRKKITGLPLPKQNSQINEASKGKSPKIINQDADQCKKHKTKRISVSFLLMILTVISILPSGLTMSSEHFKITQLPDNQPVYFDPIGNVQLIHDEWRLLVYYNLTTFWQSTAKIERYVQYLTQLCESIAQEPCNSTIKQLKFEINQLNEYNTLLRSHHDRKRRGYINGVGNLARTLFGILDSDFAKKYAQDIQKIQSNEQYSLQLIKNQTLIVEAEHNIIKKNEEFVKKQLKLIKSFITETKKNTNLNEARYRTVKIMNDINAGAITARSLISVLRRNQQMLLDALTDIYRGHLDMNLFTPEQLSKHLNHIAGIISKRLTTHIKDSIIANIRDIYKLIYVKARLSDQYLLFELHIPIISHDDYTLFYSIPITRQVSIDQCQAIATTTKYMGVNFVKNTYIQMEEVDLQQCTTLEDESFVCHAYTPIRNLHRPTASCEAKMLSHEANNVTCDLKTKRCNDQWTKLERPNIWLYNCINECTTRIICGNQIAQTSLTKTGLLALDQDCAIQHEDATVYSYNVLSSKTKIDMTLEVPIIESPNDMWKTIKTSNIVFSSLNLSDEHRRLDDKIAEQKAREVLPNDLSTHDLNNYTISTTLIVIIVLAIVVWLIRKCLPVCQRKQT